MRFRDKVVVITGASRGIGRATALAFAAEGARLLLACRSNHKAMGQVRQSLGDTDHAVVTGDIGDEKTCQTIASTVKERWGRADVLVNNAGAILSRGEVSPKDFMDGMSTNLLGTILMTQQMLPLMKGRPGASIVNVTSTFGIMGAAAVSVYTAAKAGVINYTKSMAVELAPHIRVNALAPGIVNTDMTGSAGPELIAHFVDRTPMKRLGQPEEMAKAILFMASDDASFMTGHTLIADGGHILVN
ncbi:MAG: SDR family oxidoreductase [Pseudomonadota bacterium]|nr:SDR family oxidoreductase [Pseudomonadota bacterium]